MSALVERLKRYVAIKSLSKAETELADLVATELSDAGLTVERNGNNIWCGIGDRDRPRLLLNSHLDTVPAGAGWSGDPWTPTIRDGRIIALGANDAKGCVTALIETGLNLKRRLDASGRLGGTVVLALTAEEENTGAGLATVIDQLKPIDAAIVGEPTGMIPMTAQRGLLILRATTRGRTAHPANTPGTETNAIHAAARVIAALERFDFGPPHPTLGQPHAHVTQIAGGVARNVVPDECEFWLDIRTTPRETHAALTDRLRAALKCEIDIHSQRLVPVETASDQPIVRATLAALPHTKPSGSATMSDMVFLAGIPAVKLGPGFSPRSHTPDEYIEIAELETGAVGYERVALEYFKLAPAALTATGAAAARG